MLLLPSENAHIYPELFYKKELTKLTCAIPNCPNIAKIWYNAKQKERKKKLFFLRKRKGSVVFKQIIICVKHQTLINKGKYNGPSLKKIRGYTFNNLI